MSKQEREKVFEIITAAGYTSLKPEDIQKVVNQYDDEVYVAVVGDAMVVCTPKYRNPVKFVCF